MHDPEGVEAIKRQLLEGDSDVANIMAHQAQKCAAILEAYVDGQALYREHVNTVAQFLKAAAMEAALGMGNYRPSSITIWQEIDHLPWPRSGGSQPQAK